MCYNLRFLSLKHWCWKYKESDIHHQPRARTACALTGSTTDQEQMSSVFSMNWISLLRRIIFISVSRARFRAFRCFFQHGIVLMFFQLSFHIVNSLSWYSSLSFPCSQNCFNCSGILLSLLVSRLNNGKTTSREPPPDGSLTVDIVCVSLLTSHTSSENLVVATSSISNST